MEQRALVWQERSLAAARSEPTASAPAESWAESREPSDTGRRAVPPCSASPHSRGFESGACDQPSWESEVECPPAIAAVGKSCAGLAINARRPPALA